MLSLIYIYFSYRRHALFPGVSPTLSAPAVAGGSSAAPIVEAAPEYKLAA